MGTRRDMKEEMTGFLEKLPLLREEQAKPSMAVCFTVILYFALFLSLIWQEDSLNAVLGDAVRNS